MKLTSSFLNRDKHIKAAQEKKFDLVVVGGGITGAGVARDAAMRGLSVCLVEKGDFGEGTSSRSSKLAHGGLRYLENLEFDLVGEALHERQNLLSMAPHMVQPLRFLMPIYRNDRVSVFKMKMGMLLYDILSAFNTPKFHESISQSEIKKDYPNLKNENLKSGFLYSDALMDDDRLVHETMRSAVQEGAVVMTYVEAVGYDVAGESCILKCNDRLGGNAFSISGSHTVSCVGPWTDKFASLVDDDWSDKTRPSKGVHITLPKNKLNLKTAVVMAADSQKRILFCIPREGFDIVGTTDTDFVDDPSSVRTEKEDVEYILKVLKEYYPKVEISLEDILFSYAGVRPLIDDGSASESKVSRSHWIKTYADRRITYISGGKYTTYLSMAEDCVNQVLQTDFFKKKVFNKVNTRGPFVEFNTEANLALAERRLTEDSAGGLSSLDKQELLRRHGAQAVLFLKDYKNLSSIFAVEAAIAIDHYFCGSLKDFYTRRTHYLLQGGVCVKETLPEVKAVFCKKLGWTEAELNAQVGDLEKSIRFEAGWRETTHIDSV